MSNPELEERVRRAIATAAIRIYRELNMVSALSESIAPGNEHLKAQLISAVQQKVGHLQNGTSVVVEGVEVKEVKENDNVEAGEPEAQEDQVCERSALGDVQGAEAGEASTERATGT